MLVVVYLAHVIDDGEQVEAAVKSNRFELANEDGEAEFRQLTPRLPRIDVELIRLTGGFLDRSEQISTDLFFGFLSYNSHLNLEF